MKQYLISFSLIAALVSCNNEQKTGADSNSDSAGHGGMHSSPASNNGAANIDTSTMTGGGSMMDMMHQNMEQMKAVPSTGNPDNDFAALMKIHHMGALEMAQLELQKGSDAEIKAMAQKMVSDQQKEIAELNTFLSGHSAHGGGDAFYKESMAQMNNMKMDMDQSGSIDKQFVQMMIPHHQGAIDMAKAYLKSGAHEQKLKEMANAIISGQQKEIAAMQAWLAKNKS